MEEKLEGNYTRMLHVVFNKSWKQQPTKQQLYRPLFFIISQTIQVKRTKHTGHCWRNKSEPMSGFLLWTLTHERTSDGRLARTYIHQLSADTRCSLEDLPGAMREREREREREKYVVYHRWSLTTTKTRICKNVILYFYSSTVTLVRSRRTIGENSRS